MNQAGFLVAALAAMAISLSVALLPLQVDRMHIEPSWLRRHRPAPSMSVLRPCLVTSRFPAHGTGVAGATNGVQAIGRRLFPDNSIGPLPAGNARVITGSSMVAAGTGVEPISRLSANPPAFLYLHRLCGGHCRGRRRHGGCNNSESWRNGCRDNSQRRCSGCQGGRPAVLTKKEQ